MKKISFITLMLALPFAIPLFAELQPECKALKLYAERYLKEMKAKLAENKNIIDNARMTSAYRDALIEVDSMAGLHPTYLSTVQSNDKNDCWKKN